MNRKHLAALLIGLCILGFVYLTQLMRDKLGDLLRESEQARQSAQDANNSVLIETRQLEDLRTSSTDLIRFLDAWEPYFTALNTARGAELAVSTRIKEANLITLAQRFDVTTNRGDSTIPQVVRTNLIIEDDYVKTINWLGRMEEEIPTLRIANLRLAKGQLANEVRAELILETPLAAPNAR
jgi:hypothetical protein